MLYYTIRNTSYGYQVILRPCLLSALSGIHKAIFNNPEGIARGIIEYCWVYSSIRAPPSRHGLAGLYHDVTRLTSISKQHCDVFAAIDGSSCQLSQEWLDRRIYRPRFERFSAAQEKDKDHSWVWGSIQVPYLRWGNGGVVEKLCASERSLTIEQGLGNVGVFGVEGTVK